MDHSIKFDKQLACLSAETIYRHEMSIGGDVVHFEILDTAGQVSVLGLT